MATGSILAKALTMGLVKMENLPHCPNRCVCFVGCGVCEHLGRPLEINAVKVKCSLLLRLGLCPRAPGRGEQ